ncbi:ankyrin repeat domain-containing protein [Acidovorax sp. HDW3]|uniref:ankyrin repeat domain-containing protein n=1 Tax=Acidovorax sp. HDW3 TaxID=2714923 RepID=UPI00140B0CA2|nr:ankyrin repeat domain-containing protein [Acidovorax sp. HDW3]QIL44338.1 ankyrin repeat domain-containing protein [Acidovorax sp. HDW3]
MATKIVMRRNAKHQAFSDACEADDRAQMHALIQEGLDLTEPWSINAYPLVVARYANNLLLLAYLLEQGMPPWLNLRSLLPEAPEGDLSVFSLLNYWEPGHHEAMMFLLEHGSSANSTETGYNALASLAYLKEYVMRDTLCRLEDSVVGERSDEFFAALMAHKPNVDQPMSTGGTLLRHIAEGNNRYVAPLVALSKKVDAPKHRTHKSMTPLRVAADKGSDLAVEALLKAGAKPNVMDRYHQNDSILDEALSSQANKRNFVYGNYPRVIELLRAHGAKTSAEMRQAGEIPPLSSDKPA